MELREKFNMSEEDVNEDIRRFHKISNIFRKCMQINLNKLGLSIGQPSILYAIKNFSDLSQKEVAEICQVKPPTLSRALDSLEKNGLIERCFNSDKRRTISLKLTPLGEQKLTEATKSIKEMHEAMLDGISEEEAEQVKNVFKKMKDKMEVYYRSISEE